MTYGKHSLRYRGPRLGEKYPQILDLLAKTLNTKRSVNVTLVYWWTMDARAVPSAHHNYVQSCHFYLYQLLATITQFLNYSISYY